jgi:hypothetical protein
MSETDLLFEESDRVRIVLQRPISRITDICSMFWGNTRTLTLPRLGECYP